LKDGKIHTVQRELQTDKGAWYLDITASPLKGRTGETVAVIEIIRDITQRKQAEIAMRETQRKLQNIIEHSNELYYLHDTRHVLTYASPQSLQVLGYTPEEMMIEWTRLATDNPMNREGIKITERALKTGKRQPPYVLELFKKDRSIVLLEIDESPLKDDKGNVIGIVGAARDITERRKAEEAMKRSKQELRERIKELEEFYHMAVGRELRMKQLKEENEELKEELRKKREA
jgi:PAS domain S-box-containing protein